ncbi:hypothetical protein MPH47_06190 [Psychrobacillus psychrodurans]|uniref:hypothetical protein n=1 Tax=Psychrobacillus psychrodurans TaxID=126157 RepID=UPI001F4D4ADB|nr:hypothetical protein [Psychrobacillus psychrodurans]MCK1996820.1 hypothetical protein [Psychrobacillus psychrodurans]
MKKHKNLFFICENCHHPVIISEVMEIGVLPRSSSIQCGRCEHDHNDLEEFKSYAKRTREYANG